MITAFQNCSNGSTPADGEARRLARARLERSGYSDLHRLRCECHDGDLRLSGSVSSYHHKQLAPAPVSGIAGFRAIGDEIEVRPPSPG